MSNVRFFVFIVKERDMSLLTPAELVASYGGTGTHDPDDVQLAIDLAEFDVADVLGTFLEPTTVNEEEHPWPTQDGTLLLLHNHVTAITTVTAKHSLDSDCVWQEDTECGVILDTDDGLVLLVACDLSLGECACDSGTVPDRAVVTYVAGYTAAETDASTQQGKALRMAISLRAREWLAALEQTDYWTGEHTIDSWSSMDYSEQRNYAESELNPLGPGPLSQAAWRILERIKPKPALMLRGPGRIR